MSVLHGILAMGRARKEQRFTERVEFYLVREVTVGGDVVEQDEILFADVPAQVVSGQKEPREPVTGGQSPAVSQQRVDVPVGSAKVGPSVMIRVISSTVDAGLVGSRYRTKDAAEMGQVTAWRYPVESVS